MPKHLIAPIALALLSWSEPARADTAGLELATAVFDRPANEGRVGEMNFVMTNARGQTRERVALMAHGETDALTRIAIYFEAPAAIEGTAFLTHDHEEGSDEAWLYLPATDRTRRLPASERGDYFMGTDITYGDIKDNFRFDPADWTFALDGTSDRDGEALPVLTGTARSDEIAAELGYSAFSAVIDTETLFPVEVQFADTEGEPLKTIRVEETGLIGGAWTALRFSVENLQTGHRTEVFFEDMRHVPDIGDHAFDPDAMAYGVPDIG
jgi:hypothetical protein